MERNVIYTSRYKIEIVNFDPALCLVQLEMYLLSLLTVGLASASTSPALFHLDCDAGSDAAAGTSAAAPVRSLARTQALVREQRARDAASQLPARPITIHVTGTCGAARFTAADGGESEASRVTYTAAPGAQSPPVLSGGVPVPASWLSPVTDAAVLARLPTDAARAAVRQLDLRAHGTVIPDAGQLVCKPYMGGEASILPGNLMPSGLEFFAAGDPRAGGDFAPLTLARYPNRAAPPKQWSGGSTSGYVITPDAATAARLPLWASQLADDPGSAFVHYLGGLEWDDAHHQLANISLPPPPPPSPSPAPPSNNCNTPGNHSCACFESGWDYYGFDLPNSPVPSASQAACCALCAATAGCNFYSFCDNGNCGPHSMCYLKSSNAGRRPFQDRLSGPAAPQPPGPTPGTLTLDPCPSHYNQPGFDALDDKGTYYSYNLLAELDTEGEYYINRTAMLLYVWLPNASSSPSFWDVAPWSSPVVDGERAPSATAQAHARAVAAAASATDDPIVGVLSVNSTLLDLAGASFLTFDGLVVTFGREAGLRTVNSSSIVFSNGLIENVGSMVVNVTGGSNLLLTGSTLRAGGNGAIFLYAGDRPTLTRSNHTVQNCSVSYSNRYVRERGGQQDAGGLHTHAHSTHSHSLPFSSPPPPFPLSSPDVLLRPHGGPCRLRQPRAGQ